MANSQEMAVVVKKAYKYYGSSKDPNKKVILNYLDMNVARGNIYGLLGASGCGKTTLLSCVVGRRNLVSGQIQVLGNAPAKSLAVRIGYMPQEVALVGEFTVREAIFFFGRIYGMLEDKIEKRLKDMMELMELPSEHRLIKNMSGGQQRRVSFAAVLIHEPELLILDEPTCGLDPVLRDKIWNHLVDIARTGVAVIITTHYIEETRQANMIGLMRGGELLAEESPDSLIRRFGCDSLEECFLLLAIKQSKAQGDTEPNEPTIIDTNVSDCPDVGNEQLELSSKNHYDSKDDFRKLHSTSTDILTEVVASNDNFNFEMDRKSKVNFKLKALAMKNINQFVRQPAGVVFGFVFPIIQLLCFFMAIGHDPRTMDLAIVNDEVPDWDDCKAYMNKTVFYDPEEYFCNFTMLSCRYLKSIDDDIINKKFYSTVDEAMEATKTGDVIATLYIPYNFSESFTERLNDGTAAYNGSIYNSVITVYLDMSDYQMGHFFKRKMYKDYEKYAIKLMEECDIPTKVAKIPMTLTEIYGDIDDQYTDFMAPGVVMTVLFFVSAILTGNIMIGDRLEGIWDRILVAGVKSYEVLFVHICMQTIIIFIMACEAVIITFAIYQVPVNGSFMATTSLLFLQGLNGMCFGFLVSVMCRTYTQVLFLTTGAFYPIILLSGIMWPIEGMRKGIKWLAYIMPFTVPTKSLRYIMFRGYEGTDIDVLSGFGVSILWLLIFLALCFILLKYYK